MSAAVATRQSQGPSNPTSRINSPLETKRHFDEPKRGSPQVSHRDLSKSSPKTTVKQPPARGASKPQEPVVKATASTANNAAVAASETSPTKTRDNSLPPPPPPVPVALPDEGGDYFSQVPNKYREEPNPFEESFSKPDVLTPGKTLLPPASQIASPNTNFGTGSTFNWGFNSLRSGPLSPAMLTGPSGHSYDASLRTGLTPNESGIRSGLTPGGSGTMFPAPSPNTQALFGFGSGPTPGTLEFQKTAMAAQAVNRPTKPTMAAQAIPIPKPEENPDAMDVSGLGVTKVPPQQPRHPSDPFGVDANAAANGLYMLAQQGQQRQAENQFVPANMPQSIAVPTANGAVPMNIDATGANNMKRNSIASGHSRNASTATRGQSEASEDMAGSDGADNNTGKGKKGKGAAKKGAANSGVAKTAGNRRKAEEPKGGISKKKKAASSNGDEDEDMDDFDDEDMHDDDKDGNSDPKKMTDEEKRKNFLERNRVAALKCRQRKKQWLANLQAKVEFFSAENDALTSQVTNLREEILTLKTLLIAHKDCPVSRAAGAQSMGGLDALGALTQGDYAQLHHGYPVPQVSMAPPGPRRFS
ncbi:hypothetical protein TWF694_004940 [Orbilia ellipsospora]|uniref:BZIP domain-containing protein n=1 Tax=Orbilia ellipsospora TaxID=2528407 RepID=A0AAV9X061_9PEZI